MDACTQTGRGGPCETVVPVDGRVLDLLALQQRVDVALPAHGGADKMMMCERYGGTGQECWRSAQRCAAAKSFRGTAMENLVDPNVIVEGYLDKFACKRSLLSRDSLLDTDH